MSNLNYYLFIFFNFKKIKLYRIKRTSLIKKYIKSYMSTRICAIAENSSKIIDELKQNAKLKNKVFWLNHSENQWHLSDNGLLLIDINDYAYKKNQFGKKMQKITSHLYLILLR